MYRLASVWRHTQRRLGARVETVWRQLNDQRLHAPSRYIRVHASLTLLVIESRRHLAECAAGARDVTLPPPPAAAAAAAATA